MTKRELMIANRNLKFENEGLREALRCTRDDIKLAESAPEELAIRILCRSFNLQWRKGDFSPELAAALIRLLLKKGEEDHDQA